MRKKSVIKLGNSWDDALADEFKKEYYIKIRQFLKEEYAANTIYPDMYDIFNALKLTPMEKVNAVILGQDPYHGPNQAHGLAFSVKKGVAIPPSLVNIYKELRDDIGCTIPNHGCLEKWAEQGVLLLNTSLTVRRGCANSHKDIGWSIFTDAIISILNKNDRPVVFILWGGNARRKKALITNSIHLVLECAHPSPLSAYNGFFGCKHFSKTNDFLAKYDRHIDWQID